MSDSLRGQAERFYQVFAELARGYQFRDQEEICCHGISVSQCYTLDALKTHGPMAMGDLAGRLHLEISTMTRVVDHLVADDLATRVTDAKDRRVCRVQLTRKGRSLISKIRAELITRYEVVLREIPAQSREAVITTMSRLLSAFEERESCTCTQAENTRRRRTMVS